MTPDSRSRRPPLGDRLVSMAPLVRHLLAQSGMGSVWVPGLALLVIETGSPDEATESLEDVKAGSFDLPVDAMWSTVMVLLVESFVQLGDVDACVTLRERTASLGGENVTTGSPGSSARPPLNSRVDRTRQDPNLDAVSDLDSHPIAGRDQRQRARRSASWDLHGDRDRCLIGRRLCGWCKDKRPDGRSGKRFRRRRRPETLGKEWS